MAINITGNNYGIAVDGDLKIEKIEFALGQGVKSASGISREPPRQPATAELQPLPQVDCRHAPYPEITKRQSIFFREKTWIETMGARGTATKRAIDVPKVWLLHTIYDITTADEAWNPQQPSAVRRWRLLYDLLRRQKFIDVGERPKYAEFVKSVVGYCYPEVSKTYHNNLSKCEIDKKIENWSLADNAIYREIKEALVPKE